VANHECQNEKNSVTPLRNDYFGVLGFVCGVVGLVCGVAGVVAGFAVAPPFEPINCISRWRSWLASV
jgi:hypothetical protein